VDERSGATAEAERKERLAVFPDLFVAAMRSGIEEGLTVGQMMAVLDLAMAVWDLADRFDRAEFRMRCHGALEAISTDVRLRGLQA